MNGFHADCDLSVRGGLYDFGRWNRLWKSMQGWAGIRGWEQRYGYAISWEWSSFKSPI